MTEVEAAAWEALRAALDAWMAAPSEAGWAEVERAWMHYHSV